MIIFKKNYYGESLSDLPRDIFESLDEDFNPIMEDILDNEYGFTTGKFTVTVNWEP